MKLILNGMKDGVNLKLICTCNMIREKKQQTGPIIIDLTGPDGNAYALIGYASRFAKQLDLDHKIIIKEMTSGDYENLLKVCDNYFGHCVILEK